ncbi:SDR family oxidoreductase [Variovorax paradoxus]|uniref:Putative oxidoreductase n=1 Tax=Variovorax paradoxus TaxID=34073 RepID=A0A0H2LPT3_VARPD|nr:SDR family NAD(P)-dependent oxidoreductase [Variovorax paradoxus]KLN52338.1 putative oxidoreductase [Variovorax paradoxus]
MSLSGQVAWVTGGGSGIGLAGATQLAQAGCRVVISGREGPKLGAAIETAERLGAPRGAITAAALDVADAAAVTATARAIEAELGRIDILVNSAGINFPKRYWCETDAATFEQVVAVNLNGAAYCTLAVAKGMRARRAGTVINIASFAGWHYEYMTGPAYTASKAAMMALTHSFNIEECVHGLRATALCPGEVATPILKKRPVQPSEADKARMLQEEDLGRTIRFIAEMPPHVCINELVISPVWNRTYVAGEALQCKAAAP